MPVSGKLLGKGNTCRVTASDRGTKRISLKLEWFAASANPQVLLETKHDLVVVDGPGAKIAITGPELVAVGKEAYFNSSVTAPASRGAACVDHGAMDWATSRAGCCRRGTGPRKGQCGAL